ncbi:AraC family transcriptional regulator [Nocardia sp. JMUB6875]|uniref:AraC family transcriptional regulator n=1 Tax=Nocardia sp. JMUB6875 TaxID=3158170 RepID=UPI0032E63A5B
MRHGDTALIRGTALQGYPELVAELGTDPDTLLAAAAIPRAAVGDHDALLSFRAVVQAIESAAQTTGTVDFGRRLALRQDIEILGPLAAAARTAPTTGEAFRALHRYLAVYSPAITASLDQPAGQSLVRFEYRIVIDRLPPHRQVIELALGVALRMTRLIAGQTYTPVSVHLPHDPMSPLREYRQYFGCPVYFAEPFSGFLVRPEDLTRPLASDAAVRTVVETYLDTLTPPPDGTTAGPVRTLIRKLLPTGTLDRDLIATHLAIHPRTLQRRLTEEGTTYAALVDDIRRDEAEHYLRDTNIPLSQLATLLGYSEQSALTHACHRWFGTTATHHRHTLRVNIATPTKPDNQSTSTGMSDHSELD